MPLERAPETNWPYRPIQREDLVPGAKILMINDVRRIDPTADPRFFGTIIRLDQEAVRPARDESDREMVYYHCIQPAHEIQCFVAVDDFLAPADDIRYWVPMTGKLSLGALKFTSEHWRKEIDTLRKEGTIPEGFCFLLMDLIGAFLRNLIRPTVENNHITFLKEHLQDGIMIDEVPYEFAIYVPYDLKTHRQFVDLIRSYPNGRLVLLKDLP